MKRSTLFLALILTAGCLSSNVNPDVLPGQHQRDNYVCMQQAQQPVVSTQGAGIHTNWFLYYTCMRACGWR